MEIKPIIKRIIAYVLVTVVFFLLHTSVFPNFQLGGIAPNVMVILVSVIGFMRGGNTALVLGMASGVLLDMFSGSYFGMYAVIYLVIGFINSGFHQLFFGDDMKLPLFLIASSDFVYGLLVYGCIYFMRARYDLGFYLFHVMIPEVVYTALVSLVLYFPIYYLEQWLNKSDKRSERKLV